MAEKFGAFRCTGTGIAPFLPVKPPRLEKDAAVAVLDALRDYILGPLLLFPLRLILLLAGTLVMGVGDLLDALLGAAVPTLGWYARRLFYLIGARLALFAMGFYWIPFQVLSMRKGRRDAGSPPEDLRAPPVSSNVLVVANHSSYVDLFYLAYAFTPSYFLCPTGTGPETVVARSFWKALSLVATDPAALWADPASEPRYELSQVRTKLRAAGPLVVFPEATTTNGKGLLRFLGVGEGSSLLEKCHVEAPAKPDTSKMTAYMVGLRYEYESFPPTIPVGSKVFHLFQLLCQYVNYLSIVHTPPTSVSSSLFIQPAPVNQTDLASMILGRILSQRRTTMDARRKAEFLQFYEGKKTGPRRNPR